MRSTRPTSICFASTADPCGNFMKDAFNGLTALVVEDDWVVREDGAGWFRQHGWTVLETAIGLARCKCCGR
jgi:hypothetical protein